MVRLGLKATFLRPVLLSLMLILNGEHFRFNSGNQNLCLAVTLG
jgi:hypothetical protein